VIATMQCPKCAGAALTATGPHNGCPQCGGLFVSEASFDEMLVTMSSGSDVVRTILNYPIGTERCAHACPQCGDAMRSSSIERLAVERCAVHGIWFDRTELERALAPEVTAQQSVADGGEDALGRVAETAVAVTVGGALALLVQYIGRMLRRAL
jgi:Zn-finger nucleic acid-binding protein